MHLSKKIASALAVSALAISTLIAAPAASAVTTFTVANCQGALDGQTFNVPSGETDFMIQFTSCAAKTPPANNPPTPIPSNTDPYLGMAKVAQVDWFSINVNFTGALFLRGNFSPTLTHLMGDNTTNAITDGTYQIYYGYFDNGTTATTSGSFAIVVGGGGGDNGSSSAAAATPQTFELSITPTDGTTCANSSESGRAGTWMTLPAANDCSAPESMPNAALLGWATIPNFPVEIAQRQVDNGWGAYEMFNEDGQLTAVFIPAGMPTFLSAPGKIYPIWKM